MNLNIVEGYTCHLMNSKYSPQIRHIGLDSYSVNAEQEINCLTRGGERLECSKFEAEVGQQNSLLDPVIQIIETSTTLPSNSESTSSDRGINSGARIPYKNVELRQFYKDLLNSNSNTDQEDRIRALGFTGEELDRMNNICDVMDRFWKVVGSNRRMPSKRKR